MECLGGNGYVEEWPLARVYREAPVNAIWEGSGNVMALDVLRAAARAPDATAQMIARLGAACGVDADRLGVASNFGAERLARRASERLAHLAAAAALAERRPSLADAYVATRLAGEPHAQFGACDLAGVEQELVDRILPQGD
jgi:putative acyl-CoA dehydrogenase